MKILIVNLHSSRNAGDDLLTRVTVQQLVGSFAGAELTLSMNDPASYEGPGTAVGSFFTWFRRQHDSIALHHYFLFGLLFVETMLLVMVYRLAGQRALWLAPLRHRPLLAAYFTADLVVSSAGNFLYTSGRGGLTFVVAIYSMLFAWFSGKPLYTMPQTIGPLKRGWERWLVRLAANRARWVFVRDSFSLVELEHLQLRHNRFTAVPDLAFAFPHCPPEMGMRLLAEYGLSLPATRPLLGVTLMNWGAQNPAFGNQAGYETAVAHVIRTFATTQQGQIVLFSQVCGPTMAEDDRVPARRVKEQLANLGTDVIFIDKIASTEELKAAYGLMDIFMGTRLHSNIFAISEGVPAVMIEYRYKTRGVMQMLELERWVIDIQDVQADKLASLFWQLWDEQTAVKQQMQERLPAIIAAASQVGAHIATDFSQIVP
jgi:colanic acid/amylovoran biosynthesis protein